MYITILEYSSSQEFEDGDCVSNELSRVSILQALTCIKTMHVYEKTDKIKLSLVTTKTLYVSLKKSITMRTVKKVNFWILQTHSKRCNLNYKNTRWY